MVTAIVSPERAAETQDDAADDARLGVREDGARDRLPLRRAERQRRFALRARHGEQHLARHRRDVGQDHDREDEPAASMLGPYAGPREERQSRPDEACHAETASRDVRSTREQHENAPEAVDDARDGRQQVHEKRDGLPELGRSELRQKYRDANRERRGQDQRHRRRNERPIDRRRGTEHTVDRIPALDVRNENPNLWSAGQPATAISIAIRMRSAGTQSAKAVTSTL